MFKTMSLFFLTCFLSLPVLAQSRTGGCSGSHEGQEIKLAGSMSNKNDMSTLSGSLFVSGREVARFAGNDLTYNIVLWTFKVENNHGELIHGKVTNILKKTGQINQIRIPAFGIDLKNINIECWSR